MVEELSKLAQRRDSLPAKAIRYAFSPKGLMIGTGIGALGAGHVIKKVLNSPFEESEIPRKAPYL
jgi:hypothetical protein